MAFLKKQLPETGKTGNFALIEEHIPELPALVY